MDKNSIQKKAVEIIREHLDTKYQILLFGSWAKHDAQETSDIDICILCHEKVSADVMAKIRAQIDALPTLRSLDVVDLYTKERVFQENVLQYAQRIA